MRIRQQVQLPDGRIGSVIRTIDRPGWETWLVATKDGAEVWCHPIRLRPVEAK
jgi:hypothetical protein